MRNIFRTFAVIAILAVASCSKTGSKPAVVPPTDTTKTTTGSTSPHDSVTDVYVAGGITKGTNSFATPCYWKNDTEVDLPSGSYGGIAYGIAVSDTNVYVAGKSGNVAVLWVNGVAHALTTGVNDSSGATGVYVLHDTVYVAISGFAASLALAANSEYLVIDQAGKSTEIGLTDFYYHPGVNGIYAANGHVYAAGFGLNVPGSEYGQPKYLQTPVYWQDGEEVGLSYVGVIPGKPLAYGTANAICTIGADVYAAGVIYGGPVATDYEDENSYPVYWKNRTAVELDASATTPGLGFCSGITARGTDLYISGSEYAGSNYQPCYWKNGTINWLGQVGNAGQSNGIFVQGDTVYNAGMAYVGANYNYTALLWKNGQTTQLAPGASFSNAFTVFVYKH